MTFDDVMAAIRCPRCTGTGAVPGVNGDEESSALECGVCNGSGINPEVLDEAGGWGTWAISVHERPGPIVVVPLD